MQAANEEPRAADGGLPEQFVAHAETVPRSPDGLSIILLWTGIVHGKADEASFSRVVRRLDTSRYGWVDLARLGGTPMRRSMVRGVASALSVLLLAACGSPTKEDLVQKARDVSTRAELEKALGKPSDITKLGPLEQWTYKASNGQVVFIIVGDTVTLQAAGGGDKKP